MATDRKCSDTTLQMRVFCGVFAVISICVAVETTYDIKLFILRFRHRGRGSLKVTEGSPQGQIKVISAFVRSHKL